jgi:hypothetical protein
MIVSQRDGAERIASEGRVSTALMGAHPVREPDGGPREGAQQALLVQMDPGGAPIKAHFHPVDQFQIAVGGTGRIGPEPIDLGDVHYSDAYTSYGPITPGDEGLDFISLRRDTDYGAYYMPAARHIRMEAMARAKTPRRRSLTARIIDPDGSDTGAAGWRTLREDEDGMSIRASMPTESQPAPTQEVRGRGAFLVVVKGRIRAEDVTLEQGSLGFIEAGTSVPELTAEGCDRAVACLLQFPLVPETV